MARRIAYPPINREDPDRCKWRTSNIAQAGGRGASASTRHFQVRELRELLEMIQKHDVWDPLGAGKKGGCGMQGRVGCLNMIEMKHPACVEVIYTWHACSWFHDQICMNSSASEGSFSTQPARAREANAQREKLQDLRECKMAGEGLMYHS